MGEDPSRIRQEIERTREDMGDTVEALSYKTDVKSRAQDKLTETKDRIVGRKDHIVGRVSDATPGTGDVKRAASVAQENPIGLALGAVATGFLVGMMLPSSRMEDEKLGPLADDVKSQLKETGEEALERGKDAANQAVEGARNALPGG